MADDGVIEGIEAPRPLTHDLFVNVLDELGATLDRVVITDVREHTFFAELHLVTGGATRVVSSRPSDAVALAVRTGSPLFASVNSADVIAACPLETATATVPPSSEASRCSATVLVGLPWRE